MGQPSHPQPQPPMHGVWGSDHADVDTNVNPKRQRLFIARQACENCRQKKTRCDGGNPCGLCRTAGIDCKFAERKATKNEVSLGMIFNTLQRIESKIESHLDEPIQPQHEDTHRSSRKRSVAGSPLSASRTVPVQTPERLRRASTHTVATDAAFSPGSHHSRDAAGGSSGIHALLSPSADATPHVRRPRHVPVLQYPIRQLASWPAVRRLLRDVLQDESYAYEIAAATALEQRRPPLPMPPPSDSNWLARLNVSVVKELGDKYFSTFNLGNPILDRKLFRQHSLAVAISSEFGYNIESCIVLVTMALGVMGRKALQESGFETVPVEGDGWDDGLVFFNEARKRIGLLNCDNSLQACQYHLLSGLFYAQLIRPVDWWSMVNRASACCTAFWACTPKDCDEWTMDMQSRLFWITAMFEAVLTQELDLPISNLLDFEDRVPLPTFVEFPGIAPFASLTTTPSPSAMAAQEAKQDAFCHYHFLSQIAHRIILTRLCDSMFANRRKALADGQTTGEAGAATMTIHDYPPQALEDEILHQLEQWRSQLPESLQWDDKNPNPVISSPAHAIVVPWLPARYLVAQYHLRRPLLHRALHHPDTMSREEFDKCRSTLTVALDWLSVLGPTLRVMHCMTMKFFICTQLFGQMLILHTLETSSLPEHHRLIPDSYDSWRVHALDFLKTCAVDSPSTSHEYEVILALDRRRSERLANQARGTP